MRTQNCITALLLILPSLFLTPTAGHSRQNMTNHLEYLGNPYAKYYKGETNIYARNIWDMIHFKGKIYFGAGNSSNIGPAVGSRPAPIMMYDPQKAIFSQSFLTSDDQVDQFYIFDDALYVPGNDPRESWDWGNLYKTTNGSKWIKKRTIPRAIHTLCLSHFDSMIFAGLGTSKGAGIAISQDYGDSWEVTVFPNSIRFYEFLTVDNILYATGTLVPQNQFKKNKPPIQVVEYTGRNTFTLRNDIMIEDLLPDTEITYTAINPYKIIRPQTLGKKAVYIGGTLHNTMQSMPVGLYVAKSLKKDDLSIRKVNIPNGGIPWDTYKTQDYIYVLINKPQKENMLVSIIRSHDLEEWEELFYFMAPQLIRSFTFVDGTFYFSQGCEVADPQHWTLEEIRQRTGDIFKIILYSVP